MTNIILCVNLLLTHRYVFFIWKRGSVLMKKIKSFFKGVIKETKRIRWPNFKDMVKYSSATILLLIFFGLFFYGIFLLVAFVKSFI